MDTAFAHAAFDGYESASSRHGLRLAPDGAPKWSNDAASAIAQTALRVETCDRRSTPPPEGVFLPNNCEPRSQFDRLQFPQVKERTHSNGKTRCNMFLFKRVKIRSYEIGLYFRDGEFQGLLGGRSPLVVRPALEGARRRRLAARSVARARQARHDRQVRCARWPRRGRRPEGPPARARLDRRPLQPHPAAGPVRLLDGREGRARRSRRRAEGPLRARRLQGDRRARRCARRCSTSARSSATTSACRSRTASTSRRCRRASTPSGATSRRRRSSKSTCARRRSTSPVRRS